MSYSRGTGGLSHFTPGVRGVCVTQNRWGRLTTLTEQSTRLTCMGYGQAWTG